MVLPFERKTNDNNFKNKSRKAFLTACFAVCGFSLSLFISFQPAYGGCVGCVAGDTNTAEGNIDGNHEKFERLILRAMSLEWQIFRDWLVDDFFRDHVLRAMMMMTEQMTAVAMHQAFIFGTFMDAKHQLETQRLFQELEIQAHKDYHPSEDFCWFGTAARGLAASEALGRFNSVALAEIQQSRHLGNVNMGAARSRDADKEQRWDQFVRAYCNPDDNARDPGALGSGLQLACGNGGGDSRRLNIDIDYTRAIDEPRTIDVNFGSASEFLSTDEEDIMALSANLYGHNVLTREAEPANLTREKYQHLYLALRSVAAKRSVAENSFNAIVGLKSSGTSSNAPPGMEGTNTNKFLGAVLTELGVPEDDVYTIIGRDPSYYAQLEILAKKIYQNPDFYTNLYDKPANVARKGVALKAIELMLDRAIFESQLRQEMSTSVLLATRLRAPFRAVNKNLATGSQ